MCPSEKLVSKKPQVVYDEMDVLKKLDSPNIVKIYDWFEVSLPAATSVVSPLAWHKAAEALNLL